MSFMGQNGAKVDPRDLTAPPLATDELIVIHYGSRTACTTTMEAATRLGLTVLEWRREFSELVEAGHFVQRPDGSYDAQVVDLD